jgi:hypothetical protein
MTLKAVFSPNLRVTFIKAGSGAEVGDGTAFPIKVTLDQLAEIMYRVKDAWFIEGTMDGYIEASDDYPVGQIAFGSAPDTELVGYFTDTIDLGGGALYDVNYEYARGYYTADTVPANFDTYFDSAYTPYGTWRDANCEFGIWAEQGPGFHCGFTHSVGESSVSSPIGYLPPSDFYHVGETAHDSDGGAYFLDTNVSVVFTGDVTWLGDDFFAPATEFYLGVVLNVLAYGTPHASTLIGDATYDTGAKFVLGLADGHSVSCAMYSVRYGVAATDWLLQAQEWWPYAKSSPAIPVWDSGTGVKL